MNENREIAADFESNTIEDDTESGTEMGAHVQHVIDDTCLLPYRSLLATMKPCGFGLWRCTLRRGNVGMGSLGALRFEGRLG